MGITRNKKNRNSRLRRKAKKHLAVHKSFAEMEDIVVNAKEHRILKKFYKYLVEHSKVQITMPEAPSLDSDVIFVTMFGEPAGRNFVKAFLAQKMKEYMYNSSSEDGVDLIILSDSESDSESDDICVIDPDSKDVKPVKNLTTVKPKLFLDDSASVLNSPTNSSDLENIASSAQSKGKKRKAENMKVRSQELSSEAVDLCQVTSTTDDDMVSTVTKKPKLSDSVLIIEEPGSSSKQAVDFIPLISGKKSKNQKNECASKNSCSESKNSNEINVDDSVIVIDESEPTIAPRRLRPVVIDGSNVAMEHGRTSRTFSVKGLKLAIDYFLNRGHTQVTAFVPKFRRSRNPNRSVPTTDVDVFDELERLQQVVFTPSRRVDGKNITSYDDRFIVQFAASNGGVIVSNDNYRDLLTESESFKEAIEKRLLMFCFVGDVFMVPDDPLGRNGPKLDEYLSFPPEPQTETE